LLSRAKSPREKTNRNKSPKNVIFFAFIYTPAQVRVYEDEAKATTADKCASKSIRLCTTTINRAQAAADDDKPLSVTDLSAHTHNRMRMHNARIVRTIANCKLGQVANFNDQWDDGCFFFGR
jgi:hypothetical protein